MFSDPSDSSYADSAAQDLALLYDTPLSPLEVAHLALSEAQTPTVAEASTSPDSYSGGESSDVTLRADFSIATSELDALQPSCSTDTFSWQGLSSVGIIQPANSGSLSPAIPDIPSREPSEGDLTAPGPPSQITSYSSDTWTLPHFPLSSIGPLLVTSTSLENSPYIPSPGRGDSVGRGLVVYAEYRGNRSADNSLQLRQDSDSCGNSHTTASDTQVLAC